MQHKLNSLYRLVQDKAFWLLFHQAGEDKPDEKADKEQAAEEHSEEVTPSPWVTGNYHMP